MATQLFLLDAVSDVHLGTDNATLAGGNGGWTSRALGTSRGGGVVSSAETATVAGATSGIEIALTGPIKCEWISPPVSADVTISGTITANIWALESSMSANVAINVVIEIIRANALGTRTSNTLVEIVRSTRTTEMSYSGRTVQNFTTGMTSGAYGSQTLNRGDRLRIRVFGDDAGTMASGYTFNVGYNGNSGGADGDSYVSFTETFSFESDPAGSTLYLTTDKVGLSGVPALISDFTGGDESPLSEGGNWAAWPTGGNPLKRVSNQVTGALNSDCFSYWTVADYGPDLEAYVTLATFAAGTQAGIVARAAPVSSQKGIGTFAANTPSDQAIIEGYLTTPSGLLTEYTQTWASGDKIGMRLKDSAIELWRQASGSGTWDLLCTSHNETLVAAGKLVLYQYAQVGRLDDFYAGTNTNLFGPLKAWTSRGAGVVSFGGGTETGWSVPRRTTEWFTQPLQAFTLTGKAVANIRCSESNAAANASLRVEIARVDNDCTNPTVWASWCCAPSGSDNGEVGTSEAARTVNLSGDDLAVSDGQRLRIRIYVEDSSSAAMASDYNLNVYYNGTSGGASGDTWVKLAQTLTEYVPPAAPSPRSPAVNFQNPGVL